MANSRQFQWEVYQHGPNLVPHPVVRRVQFASTQIRGEQQLLYVSSSCVHYLDWEDEKLFTFLLCTDKVKFIKEKKQRTD